MPRKLTEQRHASRASGRFAAMDPCELCGKGASLEPAWGGDPGPDDARINDLAWGKLICPSCARKAAKRTST